MIEQWAENMVDELYLIGAGVGGLLIGFVAGKIMNGGSKGPSAFSSKEMRRWNLNEEWANMVNEKPQKIVFITPIIFPVI